VKRILAPVTVATLLALTTPGTTADKPLVLDVWPGKVPGEKQPIGEEKFLEQKPGEKPVKRLTNVSKPTLTFFRPAKEKDTGAAVVICPAVGLPIAAAGLLNWGVLSRLNISPRNCTEYRPSPPSAKALKKDWSSWTVPGPLRMPTPEFPNVNWAGTAKAVTSK